MALFNYTSREVNAKIVYYGPGLSGKTTNIKYIYEKITPEKKGKLITLPTYGDRTLFFDFFPLEAGEIRGYKIRFHLYTVPGQVFYNATRKLVLKGADGVVFVADSQRDMMDSNLESMANLRDNLAELGINLDEFPLVVQYNKRDLPDVIPVEEMNRVLNPRGVPYFSASATNGDGVLETLTTISKLVLMDLKDMIETGRPKKRAATPPPKPPVKSIPAEKYPGIESARKEDISQWVQGSGEAGTGEGVERVDIGKPVPEISRISQPLITEVFNVALSIKLRVTATKEGEKIKIKDVEVSDFEPREIDVREEGEK